MVVVSLVRSRRFSPVKAPYPDSSSSASSFGSSSSMSLDTSFSSSVPSDPALTPSPPPLPRILTPAADLIGAPPLPPKPPNLTGKYPIGCDGTLKSFRDLVGQASTPLFARCNPAAFGALQPRAYGSSMAATAASPFVNRYRV